MRRPRWRNVSLRHPLTRSGAANEKAPAQAHGAEILKSGESFVHLRGSLHLQCFDLGALARTWMTGGLWLRTTLPDAGCPAKSAGAGGSKSSGAVEASPHVRAGVTSTLWPSASARV